MPGYENATCAGPREIMGFFARHMIVGLMTNSFFDTADFDDPVKTIGDYIFMDQLDPATQSRREVSLNYNIGIFNDKLVQVSDSLEI